MPTVIDTVGWKQKMDGIQFIDADIEQSQTVLLVTDGASYQAKTTQFTVGVWFRGELPDIQNIFDEWLMKKVTTYMETEAVPYPQPSRLYVRIVGTPLDDGEVRVCEYVVFVAGFRGL